MGSIVEELDDDGGLTDDIATGNTNNSTEEMNKSDGIDMPSEGEINKDDVQFRPAAELIESIVEQEVSVDRAIVPLDTRPAATGQIDKGTLALDISHTNPDSITSTEREQGGNKQIVTLRKESSNKVLHDIVSYFMEELNDSTKVIDEPREDRREGDVESITRVLSQVTKDAGISPKSNMKTAKKGKSQGSIDNLEPTRVVPKRVVEPRIVLDDDESYHMEH
ncbi:hypothetical protein K7X08_000050 [Anisodus acutangulus]|uniref:Uncharacterized protein n=1 Tax=Anisodus acutangulus TaxID=402998 RepID=A0A9Q1M2Q6_9SOLA|nr:hypothetical protein K7X08_000050 [Anisodus acutangulus]